jgi:hypothetical protein
MTQTTAFDERSPYAPPESAIAEPAADRAAYFTVGPVKFVLMSIATLDLYTIYWFYRNWKVVRERADPSISPFWRAVFTPLWTFSLGRRFREEAQAKNVGIMLPVNALGVAYLIANAFSGMPDPYWAISMVSFLAVLPFDRAARRLNGDGSLSAPSHGRFSGREILILLAGLGFVLLMLVGLFLPMPED